jgi:signal transduction histidine kinase
MVMTHDPTFKTRARVLNQLGEQLIKNEAIALLELIKNSYDADASKCIVTMREPTSIKSGEITIWDDGEGMDFNTLSNAWLEIGTSYKEDLNKNHEKKITAKFQRLRLGEKGIGRLGVHRLGREIEVITRQANSKECRLYINWDSIEKVKYIEDVPIVIEERKSKEFINHTGTKIIIKRLRTAWTRGMARDCARSILSLNSPFESKDDFNVIFKIENSDWLKGLITFTEIEQYKLFEFDIEMHGNELTKFTYDFLPWSTMPKLKSRHLTIEDKEIGFLKRMVRKEQKDYVDIDLSRHRIGTVRFKGVIFDRDSNTLNLGLDLKDKKGFKEYLDKNGGVRVFRDNMRVMDYGETGNDWLDLGGRRVNLPTKRISNNIILAAVYLDRKNSSDLVEKANREGFVENEAYETLFHAIRFAIDRIESLRKTDKDLLRKFYGTKAATEPVITTISELKNVVEQNVKDQTIVNEINRYLDRIEDEYEDITNSLIKSAGAGLNLTIVIHQIEKIIKEITAMLKKKASLNILEERVKTLSKLVEGYSILVKKSDKKVRNLKGIVEQCIFNIDFRLEAHKIKLNAEYRNRKSNLDAVCSEDHVLNALMNLIDNSIWWLGYAKIKEPEIYIDISGAFPGYVSILLADNGPGFTKPTEEIIKPFVSDKPGGMGIGLHLTNQIMESLGGKLLFPGLDIFDIPERYEDGAIIALAFKKGGH